MVLLQRGLKNVFVINVRKQEISRSIHFCLHPRAEGLIIEIKLTRLLPKGLVCLAFLSNTETLHESQQKVDFCQGHSRLYKGGFSPWRNHSDLGLTFSLVVLRDFLRRV